MQLSETVKLYPTEYQIELTRNTMSEYISTVNNIVSDYTNKDNGNIESVKEIKNIKSISKLTTADVKAKLPSALCNQCIRDAKSIVKKYSLFQTCLLSFFQACLFSRFVFRLP